MPTDPKTVAIVILVGVSIWGGAHVAKATVHGAKKVGHAIVHVVKGGK